MRRVIRIIITLLSRSAFPTVKNLSPSPPCADAGRKEIYLFKLQTVGGALLELLTNLMNKLEY